MISHVMGFLLTDILMIVFMDTVMMFGSDDDCL